MLFYPFCLTVVAFLLQMAGSGLNLVKAINGASGAPAAAIANVNPARRTSKFRSYVRDKQRYL